MRLRFPVEEFSFLIRKFFSIIFQYLRNFNVLVFVANSQPTIVLFLLIFYNFQLIFVMIYSFITVSKFNQKLDLSCYWVLANFHSICWFCWPFSNFSFSNWKFILRIFDIFIFYRFSQFIIPSEGFYLSLSLLDRPIHVHFLFLLLFVYFLKFQLEGKFLFLEVLLFYHHS